MPDRFGLPTEEERRAMEAAQVDADGDGLDDVTGFAIIGGPADGHANGDDTQIPWGGDPDGDGRDPFGRTLDEARARNTEAAAQDDARSAAERHAAAQAEYDDYVASGGRQADIDAGRTPRTSPSTGGGGSGGGGGGGAEAGLSDYTTTSADIPIWDWVSGASGDVAAAQAADAETRQRNTWDDLHNYMPTPDDLAVEFGEEKFIEGPDHSELAGTTGDAAAMEAERRALEGFEDIYNSGGLTSADRARMQLGEQEMGRSMRSQRDADMSSLRARGMGGSGAQVQSMLSAQQGGADMLASREAQMQIAAQDRAMQALGSAGDMSSRMRGQGWEEDATRRGALDDYNWRNTDDRRDSQRWNIGQRDKTAQSRSDARQESFNNRVTVTSGMTGDYAGNQSRRAKEQDDDDENSKDLAGFVAGLLD